MSLEDREKWDERYRERGAATWEPSALLTDLEEFLPFSGNALDLAGGTGRHAFWLAALGFDVTLVDISPNALNLASQEAAKRKVALTLVEADLDVTALPAELEGPWDVIVVFHYLNRALLKKLPCKLASGGHLIVIHPTLINLEKHARPGPRHLLEEGELPNIIPDLNLVRYEEGWLSEGRHEALYVGQKTG